MPVELRTADEDVDPSFKCRLCEAVPYDEETGLRTCHNGHMVKTPLCWVNNLLDLSCYEVLEITYRNTPMAGDILSCIKDVESSEKERKNFLANKDQIEMATRRAEAADAACSIKDPNGVKVFSNEATDYIEQQGAYTFYPDADYPGEKFGDGAHITGKRKGVQGVYVFHLPGDAVASLAKLVFL